MQREVTSVSPLPCRDLDRDSSFDLAQGRVAGCSRLFVRAGVGEARLIVIEARRSLDSDWKLDRQAR